MRAYIFHSHLLLTIQSSLSLTTCPYHSSLLLGPLDCIKCLHRADVCKGLQAKTGTTYQYCLYTILNIRWSNYVTKFEVLDQAEIISIEAMLLKS